MNVIKYIDFKNEVANSLAEIESDIKSIGNEMVAKRLKRRYIEYKKDFEEYTQRYDTYGLELLRDRVDRFIEEYSRELGEMLNETVAVSIEGTTSIN